MHEVVGGDVLEQEAFVGVARVLEAGESGLMIPFLIMGLLGTILALFLMAAALWRSRVAPRWLPAALVGFVLVEFAGSALSEWAVYAAGLLAAGR